MKKILFLIAIMSIAAVISGCSAVQKEAASGKDDNIASISDDSSAVSNKEELTDETLVNDSADDSDNILPSKEGYEVIIIEDAGIGEPTTYAELRDGFLCNYANLSFISYEIVSVYTQEEAFELTGEDAFTRRTSLYNVHVFYDHILNKEVDYYMNIAHAGNTEQQFLGVPMYEVGMKFAAAVFGKSDTWRVPVGELEFLLQDENGSEMAYHISSNTLSFKSDVPGIEMSISEGEKQLTLAAINNPMIFSSKSQISDLGDFIRNDWYNAGIIKAEGRGE